MKKNIKTLRDLISQVGSQKRLILDLCDNPDFRITPAALSLTLKRERISLELAHNLAYTYKRDYKEFYHE